MRRILLLWLLLGLSLGVCRADEVIEHGRWKVTYVSEKGTVKVNHADSEGAYRPVIISSVPEAHYAGGAGVTRSVQASDFAEVRTETARTDDAFGPGTRFDIIFSRPSNGDDVTLTQHFYFFEQHPWILTSLEIASPDVLRSNYLAPFSTQQTYALFNASPHNRMLRVPFDNDNFVRYGRHPLSTTITSYEVTALYEGESRRGIVIGSVDHDHWKSAIRIEAASDSRIKALCAYSGASDPTGTWDVLPHGSLVGTSITSARFFIGCDDDWHKGMEAFTEACNIVVHKRDNWPSGTPVGWMSWNVMEVKNNFTDDKEIMEYIGKVLRPMGFHNRQEAPNVISIDSWSNLNSSQERELCAEATPLNAVVGCYGCPFSLWWNEKDLDNTYYSSSLSTYTGRDVVLKANGKPLKFEGAFCLDPTHPAVKASMAKWIQQQIQRGFRYMKLDFMTCGILQADSYYNPEVHTAVEAYNEGFSYFCKKVDEVKTPIFILNSIAPLFPYQYSNARRVACDTWGSINWTEYGMNALTGGWWTEGLYQFNDPDGVPLIGKGDQSALTLGENRARLTNAAATGMVLLADNFSQTNVSGQGNPTVSRKRAENLFANADFNALIGTGRTFMPVYGYKEHNGKADGAENFAMLRMGDTLYVAVINYGSSSALKGTLPLSLLGIDKDDCLSICEIWMGTDVALADDALPYDVPTKDARIYRISLTNTGIHPIRESNKPAKPTVHLTPSQGGGMDEAVLLVDAPAPLARVTVFAPSGMTLADVSPAPDAACRLALPLPFSFCRKGTARSSCSSLMLVQLQLTDGTSTTVKL